MERCVPQLFEAQVKRTPDALAVVFEDRRMTYRELSDKANAIALELLDRGIGKGSYVPFLMERSIEVVVCMLAIMKIGAAFVPLDIHWPTERLKQLLDDLNSKVILANHRRRTTKGPSGDFFSMSMSKQQASRKRQISMCPRGFRTTCLCHLYVGLDRKNQSSRRAASRNHQSILVDERIFRVTDAAAALQTTHHVYDSAVWQLFWPLINGGKSVIPSPGMETNADYLAGLIDRMKSPSPTLSHPYSTRSFLNWLTTN